MFCQLALVGVKKSMRPFQTRRSRKNKINRGTAKFLSNWRPATGTGRRAGVATYASVQPTRNLDMCRVPHRILYLLVSQTPNMKA